MLRRGELKETVERKTVPGSLNEWPPTPAQDHACGKIIIIGEHAVVYGAKAIAMPVRTMRMSLKLTPLAKHPQREDDPHPHIQLTLGGKLVSEHLRASVLDAHEALGVEPFSAHIEGHSRILMGAGLGSSAALSVALLRTIARATNRPLETADLARYANQLEARFHGKPSGLDSAVVAYEEVLAFTCAGGPKPLVIESPWRFAIIDSGLRSSTLAMINQAAPAFYGCGGDALLARFDRLADGAAHALTGGDADGLAAVMNEAAILLDHIGVVNDQLRELTTLARNLGALAAKPTGAGGGGVLLALLDPWHADEQLKQLRLRLGPSNVFEVSLA